MALLFGRKGGVRFTLAIFPPYVVPSGCRDGLAPRGEDAGRYIPPRDGRSTPRGARYRASWKMIPSVWRWPERRRLTPWRMVAR